MAMLKTVTVRAVSVTQAEVAEANMSAYLAQARKGLSRMQGMARYLDEGSRGGEERLRAWRQSDDVIAPSPQDWPRDFRRTKRLWGKEGGRPYYHFVVSPAPEDGVTHEACADLAQAWVEECFPGAQWVIAIHDDNRNHVTHAHVVVNSVHPETGRKIHVDNGESDAIAAVLQRLCRERGLTPMMDNARRKRLAHELAGGVAEHLAPQAMSAAERAMRDRGQASWSYVATVRDAVDEAVRVAVSWEELMARLRARGIECKETRRGMTFTILDFRGQGARRVASRSLGGAYTPSGLRERLGTYEGGGGAKEASLRARGVVRVWHGLPLRPGPPRPPAPRRAWRHEESGIVRFDSWADAFESQIAMAATDPFGTPDRLQGLVDAIAFAKERGWRNADEFVSDLAGAMRAYEEADARAETSYKRASAAEGLSARVAALAERREALEAHQAARPRGPLKARAWREEAERMAAEVSEEATEIADRLDKLAPWAKAHGIEVADDPSAAVREVTEAARHEADAAEAKKAKAAKHRDDLMRVARALGRYAGPLVPGTTNGKGNVIVSEKGQRRGERRGTTLPPEVKERIDPAAWAQVAMAAAAQAVPSMRVSMSEAQRQDQQRKSREAMALSMGVKPEAIRPPAVPALGRRETRQGTTSARQQRQEGTTHGKAGN